MRALIVDDELLNAVILMKYLGEDWECDFAINGTDAVDSFVNSCQKKVPYDLVCMDIMMPEMSGLNAVKALRDYEASHAVSKKAGILIVTALADTADRLESHACGCDGYLVKPVTKQQFTEELQKLDLCDKMSCLR